MAFLLKIQLWFSVVEFHCPCFDRERVYYHNKTLNKQLQKRLNPNDFAIFMKWADSCCNICCQMSTLLHIVTHNICRFAALTDSAVYQITNTSQHDFAVKQKIGSFNGNRCPESENDVTFFISRLVVAQFCYFSITYQLYGPFPHGTDLPVPSPPDNLSDEYESSSL